MKPAGNRHVTIYYSVYFSCFQEAVNMVMPAMQLASKIPDVHVQLWASALLKGSCKKFLCVLEVVTSWAS